MIASAYMSRPAFCSALVASWLVLLLSRSVAESSWFANALFPLLYPLTTYLVRRFDPGNLPLVARLVFGIVAAAVVFTF